ncbi:enoyl-CoA hydratase/isomerase family protein [Alkalicaulis satelles]|uniref:3-hydroxyisobutyryl-CoA hydrolase n=1 Tax=Alkalicaulis satelles TaxID=2609175 RepID=A0A5M6ZJA3_9PROT|nr:enoyl-CoA hydratase/isomerase family protein [Alkalicaulis satelles]KAA5804896.1 enoyl-CoA hydratase/isomerase family protein [Alkalicaulis satelles]
MTDDVIIRRARDCGRITLNRPKALNALNQDMVDAMYAALKDWREDDSVKAVVVDGAGEKGFCAGGDIRMLAESGKAGDGRAWRFWRDEYRLNTLIAEYPKPYIALIDGITMGGGVGVSVHGDFRVAGDRTTFAMPETGIGFHPDVGGAYFLPRLIGEVGTWMGLTGARLKAADCILTGVATHYVPSEQRPALIEAFETRTLDSDGEAAEALLDEFSGDPGQSDLALTRGLIDSAFAGDDVAAMEARLEAAGDSWSLRQLDVLRSKSPTACTVTLAALRRGASMNFREVMAQDLRVSMRFLEDGSDFYEGVRAVILDKDNAPRWAARAGNAAPWFAPLADDQEMSFENA